jgi:hypothetical protein
VATGAGLAIVGMVRHIAYVGAWKKAEPFWDLAIRAKLLGAALPFLEAVLESRQGEGQGSAITEALAEPLAPTLSSERESPLQEAHRT